ncbi:MAG TPA: hypothetical protein VI277_04885, partial [Candidatus Limnocylindria bacterium]
MDRSGAASALRGIVTLLPGAILLGAVAVLFTLPPVHPAQAGLDWLPIVTAVALLASATVAALACLVDGLRQRSPGGLLECGTWAALAGAGIALLAGAESIAMPVAGAAVLLVAATLTRGAAPVRDTMTTRLGAVAVLVLAESFVLATLVPTAAAWLGAYETVILVGAVVLFGVALVVDPPSRRGSDALLIAGATGMLLARDGSLEAVLGVGALSGAALVAAIARLDPRVEAEPDEDRLPELAAKLSDAVLRFDGGLALREWNGAAADLMGLDAGSLGVRAEDLLGVSLADLGTDETAIVTRGAVGG